MRSKPRVLAIIPARGGSKGVPRKNMRLLAGKPLIAWTIQCALMCRHLDRVIVSTDSKEISDVAKHYMADVPFIRPAELSQDDTPDLPVCQHALAWVMEHDDWSPDFVVWLRPTVPLRLPEDITNALQLFFESDADCIRSVCCVEHHPYWMYHMQGHELTPMMRDVVVPMRRQDLPEVFRLNGAVDVVRTRRLPTQGALFQGRMLGYVMPAERSVDIDHASDFRIAEAFLK